MSAIQASERQAPVIVSLQNAVFAHGRHEVLRGASLELKAGEQVIITGENGAGKSTLVQVILGERALASGKVRLFGEPPAQFRAWEQVGYVPQVTDVPYDRFPASVYEVVAAQLYALKKEGRFGARVHKREQVATALAEVGLAGFERRMIGELSGGQFQQVLLARALVCSPDLLVLDEPTSGLDAQATASFEALLATLQARRPHLSVLLVTHDIERLASLRAVRYRLVQGLLCRDECVFLPESHAHV